ncbi:hypothetical protein L1987_20473 [Smallanthus sonchifolius]|uniref:Uncharacterized protein n=1 Tax=Smallanthus sonchifolius TaxID=185202 RepID=A0ACB9ITN0_9ASTR|nr:hypothetical protein L1987_20473 [Smallanthus sonchifolius]
MRLMSRLSPPLSTTGTLVTGDMRSSFVSLFCCCRSTPPFADHQHTRYRPHTILLLLPESPPFAGHKFYSPPSRPIPTNLQLLRLPDGDGGYLVKLVVPPRSKVTRFSEPMLTAFPTRCLP